jgi:DNA-binding CsgD family transcriptional regulator
MQPALALLLERNRPRAVDLHEFAERFRLTRREREAVELLMRGFTSKEIAARMNISVNTVKAFLRLVMLKTSVSTRSGIIGKVFHQEPGQGLPRFPAEASRAG